MFDENDDNEYTNDNDFLDDEEDISDLNVEDEEIENDNTFKLLTYKNTLEDILKNPKKTFPLLTKFERARIVGTRLQQIAVGAKPMIDTTNLKSIYEIVDQELIQRKIPFIIRRILPNGIYEDWKLEEFETI